MIAPPFILEIYTTALIVAVASESIPMCTVLDVKKLQYKCMGIKTTFMSIYYTLLQKNAIDMKEKQ
jgi:hypothetical protein